MPRRRDRSLGVFSFVISFAGVFALLHSNRIPVSDCRPSSVLDCVRSSTVFPPLFSSSIRWAGFE
ncbi:uncharacterized protein SCHCODRAFT_02617001 [Schizophyllum commune H4-8]|uniref:uncharacterized protein n=1 Tax=Schizophyllum commune (strain H4-8 / FGSC 9210) TaxID=578458 RepID=UPI00215FF878|nr:uncharacterized protein SCHCODRAFT_02617001 [Schizophyllum commune H4-8]KAI5897251.1 hypothetical protein SCHCODRAFT_02617001 [Schizophyllum commune H4-8]